MASVQDGVCALIASRNGTGKPFSTSSANHRRTETASKSQEPPHTRRRRRTRCCQSLAPTSLSLSQESRNKELKVTNKELKVKKLKVTNIRVILLFKASIWSRWNLSREQ